MSVVLKYSTKAKNMHKNGNKVSFSHNEHIHVICMQTKKQILWAWPGQLCRFWLLYSVEFGSFSSSECGLGSMNYDSHHPAPTQKKSWQCYVKEIWLWLRMWQLLKVEDSAEFEWMASTKPHWILGIMDIYRFILLFYVFQASVIISQLMTNCCLGFFNVTDTICSCQNSRFYHDWVLCLLINKFTFLEGNSEHITFLISPLLLKYTYWLHRTQKDNHVSLFS